MKNRSAAFVDAGYLFAAGSALLAGSKQPRYQISIKEDAIVRCIKDFSANRTGCDLLRIYWYDGATARGLTPDHHRIASCDEIKLRLGFINSAGDEDTRIGVQIAQSYGVRIHLLGIEPARSNQSKQLIQESDTTSEWTRETVTSFLSVAPGLATPVRAEPPASPVQITPRTVVVPAASVATAVPSVAQCAEDLAAALEDADIYIIGEHWSDYRQIPKLYDGRLLGSTRDRLRRNLTGAERMEMRDSFVEAVRQRHPSGF